MAAARRIGVLPARLVERADPRGTIGFLGLATDRVGLRDFEAFLGPFPGLGVHAGRVPMAARVTPASLAELAGHLAGAAALLLPGAELSAVVFSCTSGTVAIGPARVAAEIARARPGVPVLTPLEAAVAALGRLGAGRVSLLAPYDLPTTAMVADHLEGAGLALDRVSTLDLAGDAEMNRVAAESLIEAGRAACAPASEALFVSCTGLATRPVVAGLEATLGRPVVTSNQALAWAAARAAGIAPHAEGQGRLFSPG